MVEGAPNHGCLLAYFIIITLGFTVDISNYLLMGWRSTFNCGALPVCKYEYLYLLMCPWVIVWITATDNQQIRHKWSAANWVMGWYSWQKWAIRSNQRHAELKILSWPTQELWALVRSWQSNGFAVWICLGSPKRKHILRQDSASSGFPHWENAQNHRLSNSRQMVPLIFHEISHEIAINPQTNVYFNRYIPKNIWLYPHIYVYIIIYTSHSCKSYISHCTRWCPIVS